MWLDYETMCAIRSYVNEGRRPGHFVRALLMGDRAEAWETAYDSFKQVGLRGETQVDQFLRFVAEDVPEEARGSAEAIDRWMEHRGLEGAPDNLAVLIKLRHENRFWER